MPRFGYIVALIALFPVCGFADSFVSVFPERVVHAHLGSGASYDSPLWIHAVNSDVLASDALTISHQFVRVEGVPNADFQVTSFPTGNQNVNLSPGETRSVSLSSRRTTVRVSGTNYGDYNLVAVYRVTVTSALTGTVSVFEFKQQLAGTISSGTPGLQFGSALEFSYSNAAPTRQVWYEFVAANASGQERALQVWAQMDVNQVQWLSIPVPATEGPHPFSGAFIAPADFLTLQHPGGVLIEGVGSFNALTDEGPWQAGVLFSGQDPEMLKVRLEAEIFSDVEQTLIVRDQHGIVVGSVDVAAGAYAASLDLEFMGLPDQSIALEATADGYTVTPLGSLVVAGGGAVNTVGAQVHKSDDPPTLVGSTSVTGTADGETMTTVTRTVENSQGSFTWSGNPLQAWNPTPGFSVPGNISGTGVQLDTWARLDSEIRSMMGGQPGFSAPDHGDAVAALDGIADGFGNAVHERGIGTVAGPSAMGAIGIAESWTVNVPAMMGYSVPPIEVPIGSPVVAVIRGLLLVASSLWWLFKGFDLLRT